MKVIYIFILFTSLLLQVALAQKTDQEIIDSILQVLPRFPENREKVDLLNHLSKRYDNVDTDEGIKYAAISLGLATRLKYEKGKAYALYSLAINYTTAGDFETAMAKHYASLEIMQQLTDKAGIANNYNGMGIAFIYQSKYKAGIAAILKSAAINKQIGDKKTESDAYNNIAAIYTLQYQYAEALAYYANALKLKKETGDKKGEAAILGNIAVIYKDQGKYIEALQNNYAALKINIELTDLKNEAYSYSNIGDIYRLQDKLREALQQYFKSLALLEKVKDKTALGTVNQGISDVYYALSDYATALKYDSAALLISKALSSPNGLLAAYSGLGNIYKSTNQPGKALQSYLLALSYADLLADTLKAGYLYDNIATAYNESGTYRQGEVYGRKANTIATRLNDRELLKNTYLTLTNAFTGIYRYDSALFFYKKYIFLKDSLTNTESLTKATHLQDQYEFDKKEAITRAETEKRMALTAANHRANMQLGILSGIALLLLSYSIFLIYNKRQKEKFQQQVAALRQEALNAQMSDHFIGRTMETITAFIEDNNKEKAGKYLSLFSDLIVQVMKNASKRMITLEEDLEMLRQYLQIEKVRFPEGSFNYHIDIDPAIDTFITLIPPMILQTLAENAVHHGLKRPTGNKLSVSLLKKDSFIECRVEDNGIGRAAALRQKLAEGGKPSYGNSIAEKLVRTVHRYWRQSYFTITDLTNSNQVPTGTLVTFIITFKSYE